MTGTSQTPQKRPPQFSLPLKLALLAISATILVPVFAVLALYIPAVQNQIIPRALTRIEEATQLKVEMESYSWSPFSRLHLTNLKLLAEGRKILDCEKVGISYSLTLNRPYVKLEEIFLERPLLQLERNAEGKWLVPVKIRDAQRNEPGKSPWGNVSLPILRISSGTVEGRQQDRIVLSVRDITGVIPLKTVQGPGGPEIRLDLDNWQASFLGQGTSAISGWK